jgi:glycosyltransferase involved in cell wall biosynthesis
MEPGWQIPSFEVAHSRRRANRHAVCVFVINEGDKVRKQLLAMKEFTGQADVIIADGGSTDGAFDGAILEDAEVTALLVKTGPGKLSAQMRMGLAWCLDQGFEGVITIDGNGKDGLAAIPRFVELLDNGYDHIQGSRFVRGGKHYNTPSLRYLGVRLLHAPLISLAAHFRYTDTTNGFRGYSRRLLRDERVLPFRDCFEAYELHYYLAIRAARLGLRCTETPVVRSYPPGGTVPTKIKGLRGNLGILRTLWRSVRGDFDP